MMRVTSAVLFTLLATAPGTFGFFVQPPPNVNAYSKHQTNLVAPSLVAPDQYSFALQQENTQRAPVWGAPTPTPKKKFWGSWWSKGKHSSNSPPPPSPTELQAVQVASYADPEEGMLLQKDFRLSGMLLTLGFLLDSMPFLQDVLGPIITLFGGFVLMRTMQLDFVVKEHDFAFHGSGLNAIVGGKNEWSIDSIQNYEFFPKGWEDQPQGPILAYMKEIQTPRDKWNTGPGRYANSDKALTNGAVPGMVHFMPAIFNPQQLKREFERRGVQKL